jgi:hypothetical protein
VHIPNLLLHNSGKERGEREKGKMKEEEKKNRKKRKEEENEATIHMSEEIKRTSWRTRRNTLP